MHLARSVLKTVADMMTGGGLKAPAGRLRLRDDFPPVFDLARTGTTDDFAATIRAEAERASLKLDRLTLIYPHKAPGLFRRVNTELAEDIARVGVRLGESLPGVEIEIAHGLCETRSLNRSSGRNQGIVKTILKRHSFEHFPWLQATSLPLLSGDNDRLTPFVLIDDTFCQGSTAANMISFVEHNGGVVLAAAATRGISGSIYVMSQTPSRFLTQQEQWRRGGHLDSRDTLPCFRTGTPLRGTFGNEAYNRGAIPLLAEAFIHAARKERYFDDLPAEAHLERVDAALRNNGLALETLTNGECYHIAHWCGGSRYGESVRTSYSDFMNKISQPPLSLVSAPC